MRLSLFLATVLSASFSAIFGAGCTTDTALSSADCPSAPSDVKLLEVAPVWGGLLAVEFQVRGGEPEQVELEVYNPFLKLWEDSYGQLNQRDDGTYVSLVSPPVRDEARNLASKLRLRTRTQGCPLSNWVETTEYTLTNPLVGTSWKVDLAKSLSQGQPSFYQNGGPGTLTYVGPYSLNKTKEFSHTISFAANGTAEEEFKFAIDSGRVSDAYAGCSFDLHFSSNYYLDFSQGPYLQLFNRKPTASPTAGSVCAAPALATLAIAQAMSTVELPPATVFLQFDSRALLATPPGPAKWSGQQMIGNAFFQVMQSIASVTGPDQSQSNGGVYFNSAFYSKQ